MAESAAEVKDEKSLNAIWNQKYGTKGAKKGGKKAAKGGKKHALPAALKAHEFKKGQKAAKKGSRKSVKR